MRILFVTYALVGMMFALTCSQASAAEEAAASAISGANAEVLRAASRELTNAPVLVSPAEKLGRELRYDNALSVSGQVTRTLWKLRPQATLDAAFNAAADALPGTELFACRGRDCGRSTAWANLVFAEPLVYGQSRYQRYRVVRDALGHLQLLYAVQRGNRRIHLLHEAIEPVDSEAVADIDGAQQYRALAELNKEGVAMLQVVPDSDGGLTESQLLLLQGEGASLAGLVAGSIYVVCHLYGGSAAELQEPDVLLANSVTCAQAAASRLEAGYAGSLAAAPAAPSKNRSRSPRLEFVPFGAGSLLPRRDAARARQSRIELVAPALLWRD